MSQEVMKRAATVTAVKLINTTEILFLVQA